MHSLPFFDRKNGPFRSMICFNAATRLATGITGIMLAAFISAIFCPFLAAAQQDTSIPFLSSAHMIEFRHDPSLTPKPVELPQSVIALIGPDKGFPSFNILVSAESYDPASVSGEQYRTRILNDYRAVGISDAKTLRTFSEPIAGITVHTTELRYQLQDQLLVAAVILIPGGSGKHFILTYMDTADQFYRRKALLEQITDSLKLLTPPPAASAEEQNSAAAGSGNYWVIVLTVLLLALAAGSIVLKRRASSGTP